MGLDKGRLEWLPHKHDGQWIVRISNKNGDSLVTRRFAHVNVLPLGVRMQPDKVFVECYPYTQLYQQHWCDSVEEAKILIEAIFALED